MYINTYYVHQSQKNLPALEPGSRLSGIVQAAVHREVHAADVEKSLPQLQAPS